MKLALAVSDGLRKRFHCNFCSPGRDVKFSSEEAGIRHVLEEHEKEVSKVE